MRGNLHAITFDVGGTLIEPWPSVGHVYAAVAGEHGMPGLSPEDLNQRFLCAWVSQDGRAESREDWAAIVRSTFEGVGPFEDPDALFESLYARFAEPASWHVFHDVFPTLTALRERGFRLGVLSNWDDRLRPLLERLGLTAFFDVIVISCEVGHRKPAPEIFLRAARALNLEPNQILHVGDSPELDVQGATRAGLQAIGLRQDSPRAGPRWMPGLERLLQQV